MGKAQEYQYDTCTAKHISLTAGVYLLEVWGAEGGEYSSGTSGKGGYSKGELSLDTATQVYIHIGGQGQYDGSKPGCNGGGISSQTNYNYPSGGGATDIRLNSDSLYTRIIVAGGGGGGDEKNQFGGFGGGLTGGSAGNDGNAGKGGTQKTGDVGCVDSSSSYPCNKGTFGYGGNSTGDAPGAGGGWYGGSASTHWVGSGGGSGYILTDNSYKPSGYLLTDKKYFLKNAETIEGNKTFKSPTGSTETGHTGNGYARITFLHPARTPKPTPKPSPKPTPKRTPAQTATATLKATMIGIRPELRFTFRSNDNGEVVKDKRGMFMFQNQKSYTARVKPGQYHFYANGSHCGHSIFTKQNIGIQKSMNVNLTENVDISIDKSLFLRAPGNKCLCSPFIDPEARTFFNFSMNTYQCTNPVGPSLIISYNPMLGTCPPYQIRSHIEPFTKIMLIYQGFN